MITKSYIDELTYKIIGCAIEVHKVLGPGLLESVYEKCLMKELHLQGLSAKKQFAVPIIYKGENFFADLRLDILVEDLVCVELKAQEGLLPIHTATLMSYMQLLEKPKGVLINFHCTNIFKEGQKTIVNRYFSELPD
jgi:GxxExxY protein